MHEFLVVNSNFTCCFSSDISSPFKCSLLITILGWSTLRWCSMIWHLVAMRRLRYKGPCMPRHIAIWVLYIKTVGTWKQLLLAMKGTQVVHRKLESIIFFFKAQFCSFFFIIITCLNVTYSLIGCFRCLAVSPNFEIAKNNMAIALTDLGTKVDFPCSFSC